MSVPVYDSAAWSEKLMALPREGARSVTAFYEHRMGAICTDARFLLVPLDDHMVHRGDAIFESLTLLQGRVLQLDAHLARMRGSAEKLELNPSCSWEDVREIILATNPNVEGETTAAYIARMVKPLEITVTRLASGMPVGGELDFVDEVTLGRAIEARREL